MSNAFKRKKFNIYLAGKVRKYNDWRDELCKTGLRDFDNKMNANLMNCEPIEELNPEKEVLISGDNMTGAFAIGDDHGCFHGENRHGLMAECEEPVIHENQVLQICINAIKKSDVIFAWIDEKTCYGTIAEIGYAYALNKYIFIGFHNDVINSYFNEKCEKFINKNDMWFINEMANESYITKDVVTAFQKMCFKIHIES